MKLQDNKQTFFSKAIGGFKSLNKSKRSVVFLLAFAVIGAIIVLTTHAATNTASIELESGTKTGNASSESDASASGGSYVKFGLQAYQDIVVSPTGVDTSTRDGSTPAVAFKTIKYAVSKAGDNSRIRIMAGTYIEQVLIQNKNNIIVEPYGDGDVTMNGAIPKFITGASWNNVQSGIYKHVLSSGVTDVYNSDGNTIYDADGKQLWSYSAYSPNFINRMTVNQLPGVYVLNNIFGVSEVYVATDTGQAPTAPLYIGGGAPTLYVKNVNGIRIQGLTNSKFLITYGHENIQIKDCSNANINNVEVFGGRSGIIVNDTSNVSIKNNHVHGTFGRDWDWADVKERNPYNNMEGQAIHIKPINKDMDNVVVDSNEVNGYFNGIGYSTETNGPLFITNSVISNNIIHDSLDDGIEIDGQYKNLVIKSNTVYDVYSPFSATGGAVGPVDVYENLFVASRQISDDHGDTTKGPGYPIKMNNVDYPVNKNLHFYFNTFYYAGGPGDGRYMVHSTAGRETSNVSFTDNIFYSYEKGLIRGTGRAQDSIEWDGNLFYSQNPDDPNDNFDDNYWSWDSYYNPDNVNNYISLSQIIGAGKMPAQWQGNFEGNPVFNCVYPKNAYTPLNPACFRASASITKPATKQPIPAGYSESNRLNSRTRLGAFE